MGSVLSVVLIWVMFDSAVVRWPRIFLMMFVGVLLVNVGLFSFAELMSCFFCVVVRFFDSCVCLVVMSIELDRSSSTTMFVAVVSDVVGVKPVVGLLRCSSVWMVGFFVLVLVSWVGICCDGLMF